MSDAGEKLVKEPRKRFGVMRRLSCAGRGIAVGICDEWNFTIYSVVAAFAVAAGLWQGASRETWCLLLLCVTLIFFAEMVNCAIEHLARAITREQHPEIRDALDIASGGVLITTFGTAAVVAIMMFWPLVKALL